MLTIKNRRMGGKASTDGVGRVTPCAPTHTEPLRRARSDAPYLARMVCLASAGWLRTARLEFWLFVVTVLLVGCSPPGRREILQGERLFAQGKYLRAAEKFREATVLLPSNATAWNQMGVAYQLADRLEDARKAYDRALTLNRDLVEARYNLGCVLLEQNRLDAARAELTAYTLQRTNSAEGFLKLGLVQLRLRDFAGADKSLQDALRIGGHNPEALNALGIARLQRARPADAAQCFSTALKAQPDYAPAALNLAVTAQAHLKDLSLAVRSYRHYLAIKPAPPNAAAVQAVLRQLEQDLPAPTPPQPAQTNLTVPVTNPPSAQTTQETAVPRPQSQVSTGVVQRASSPPPKPDPVRKPEPSPTSPKSNATTNAARLPAAATGATSAPPLLSNSETVTLAPEPVLKAANDNAATPEKPGDTAASHPTITTSSAPVILSEKDKPAKRGFLQTINPLNLFKANKAPQKATPLPPPPASNPPSVRVEQTSAPPAATSPPAVTPPPAPRYAYKSPPKPEAGNRASAERVFAPALQAHQASRLPEAIQGYRQALALDPAYYEASYNLGLALSASGNPSAALAAYETALAIQPSSIDARYNFALTLRQAGFLVDAVDEFEKVLAASPNDTRSHLALGNLYAQQLRQPAKARVHYRKLLEIDPRHPQASAIRNWLALNP